MNKQIKVPEVAFFTKTKEIFIRLSLEEVTNNDSEIVMFSVRIFEFNPKSNNSEVIKEELHQTDFQAKEAFDKYYNEMIGKGYCYCPSKHKGVLQ